MYTIDELLIEAFNQKASDVHLTVGMPPIYRIHGKLRPVEGEKLTPQTSREVIKPIMSPETYAKYEDRGEIDFSYSIAQIGRYRVNVFNQRGSMAAAIRLVDSVIPTPDKLGIPDSVVELYEKKRGLILVTGPTGSGKSTTLASLIDQINRNRNAHVITLEDPIEYLHKHNKSVVNQREVGVDSMSFSNALRASLRQDPDIILVGEMRDLETISIAITAAETGHLVLSTLHTIGAANTIDRIIDVFPPHQQQQIRVQLSTVLVSIVSQQLLPSYDGRSRVAAFEVLHANQAIRSLIRENKTHQITSIIQTNRQVGMQTMDESILALVKEGRISREQAIIFATDPASLERRI
ncbi:MAG: type IV pilus twitching motility protein PilT [Vallitaleaceae bacterium]|nr:type IV pilus twitching motility protein PilT [Vallitaleaceae bacterium]